MIVTVKNAPPEYMNCRIFVNAKLCQEVFLINFDKKYVVVYKKNKKGKILLTKTRRNFKKIKVYGKIKVFFLENKDD